MKAIIFGATGLVGSSLLHLLLKNNDFERLIVVTRRPIELSNPKINNQVIDFDRLAEYNLFKGADVVFCCLGTTIRKAGSKAAFELIDLHYPVIISELASRDKIPAMITVSSVGANASSSNFYLKTKGKMEKEVLAQGIDRTVFLQPGLLLGNRKEFRFGEKIGAWVMTLFGWTLVGSLSRFQAVKDEEVANAMIVISTLKEPQTYYNSHSIKLLAKKI